MAEIKKYLDYDGLKHLVEKLTDRIEAVGSGTGQGTALEVRWMYKGISPTLRSGDNSVLAKSDLEDDDIIPRVLFCISGSDVDVWVNGVEHKSLFGGTDTGADAQIPGIEDGVNVIRIVPQSDDARIWCNPAGDDWYEERDGGLPAKLAVTAVTDWGRWKFADCRNMFSTGDDGVMIPYGLLRQLAEPVRDVFSEVTDFYCCFSYCSGLTSLPEGLFASCTAVTNFSCCFRNCSGLTGQSAYDLVGTAKIHLYEREAHDDIYVAPNSFRYCYYGCEGLYDYDDIPSGWR